MDLDSYSDKILDYWFKSNNFRKWFNSGQLYDKEIEEKFSFILKEAEKGNLLHWLKDSKSFLAHIILLDQFSRHIYRGKLDAYKNDAKVLKFMEMGIDLYIDSYNAIEKMFALMPYQHSENIEEQNKGIFILQECIKKEQVMSEKNTLKTALFHQKGHLKVLQQFGRFPKRNYLLGRLSNEKEVDYMDSSEKRPY
jgi:uncharacterized protein (DUF924 family)